MWVLLILMFVAIWNFFSDVPKSQSVPFSEFITDVRNDRVATVTIKDHEYKYTLKGDTSPRPEQKVTVGVQSEELNKELFSRARNLKVTVEKDESSPLWASALVKWLPMVFLLVMF